MAEPILMEQSVNLSTRALVRYALDDVGRVEGWLQDGALTATILLSEDREAEHASLGEAAVCMRTSACAARTTDVRRSNDSSNRRRQK